MKISFTTLSCPKWSWSKVIDEAGRLGYDGIEIRGIGDELYLPNIEQFKEDNQKSTLKELADRNLEISCFDTSCIFHEDSKFDASIKEGKETIDLASEMGIPYIRVFGDKLPDTKTKEETIAQVAKGIEELGKYAEGKGVMVLQETHGDFSNSDYLLEVLKRTSSSAIGVLWDVANPYGGNNESIPDTYNKLKKYIKHTHIKDIREDREPCLPGKGIVPINEVISLLKEDGYEGYLSFEWEKRWHSNIEEPEVALPYYIEYVKSLI